MLALVGTFGAACGATPAALCEPVVSEALDPLSGQHVLPGSDVTYLDNPPTSGPHFSLPPVTGLQTAPLEPALQVTALEAGSVIIHHQSDNPGALGDLATNDVIVVQSPDLDNEVVFTAWQTRQRCSGIDIAAARAFVRDHADKAPSHTTP